jgi:hypothetical protein
VGAPVIVSELRAVSGSSEWDQSGSLRWLNDSKHVGTMAVKGRRRKKGCSPGGCSFYRRCWRERRGGETVGGTVVVVKPWAWQRGGGHGWNGVGMGSAIVRIGWLTSGAHVVLHFPELSKPNQNWKLKMDALLSSRNSQLLHVAILGYYEQFLNCADTKFSLELELKILE